MKSINNNAPVKNSNSITIHANSKTVWEILTNINNWPAWNPDVSKSKLNGILKPKTTFDWKSGGAKIHSTLQTVTLNNQFGWTGKSLGTFAIHNWTITEKDGKTTVHVEESMEGFLAILLKKYLNNVLETGNQKWLELLKKECEK